MKKLTFVIAVMVSVLFVSCEDLQEITEVGIETLIEADMPVASIKATSIGTESDKVEEDIYGFVGGGMFSLSDNEDIEGYIDNIRDIIALEGSLIQFNGAVEGNKILTIHLKYGIMTDSSTEPSMRSVFSFSGQLSAKNGSIKYLNDRVTNFNECTRRK